MDIKSHLGFAASHMQAGRLDQAERLYREILAAVPEEPNALYGLGFIALTAKAYEEASRLLGAAVARVPRNGHWQLALGDACRQTRRWPAAIRAYEKAARLMPKHPMAHGNLGAVCIEAGDYPRAAQALRRAVDLAPGDPKYLANLGTALLKLERFDEAEAVLTQALASAPDWVPALVNLGHLYLEQGEYAKAVAPLERAVALMPGPQQPRDNLSIALMLSDRGEEAVKLLRQGLRDQPTPVTYTELCRCLVELHRPAEAEQHARDGLLRFPDEVQVHAALGHALTRQGRVEEGIAVYRGAQRLTGNEGIAAAGVAFLLNAIPSSPAEQRAAAEAAARQITATVVALRPPTPRHPDRRLRVGYVSPDFRRHSVAYFFEGLLAAHDRKQFEVACYSSNAKRDEVTERLRALSDRWVEISGVQNDEAARRIQRDRVDILVDLAGHTSGNRLGVFARSPAPLQMTYLGYPSTTGLPAMQYRLTDGWADPPGLTDPWYTEKLLRLPRVFVAYAAPPDAPEVESPPRARGGPLTFGSFNAVHKLSDAALSLWSAVLNALPEARLLLKTAEFGDLQVAARYREKFAALGVGPERVELLGFQKEVASHLALYHRIDIAFDTFPYHGTTTTCEALYMGVPVVSLAGETHASRVGVSLLHAVGLDHLVARTPEAFVDLCTGLAARVDELALLRQTLRQRMAASPLMDAADLARAVEVAYRQAWREACRR